MCWDIESTHENLRIASENRSSYMDAIDSQIEADLQIHAVNTASDFIT